MKKRLDVILPRKYEACLSCGQLIMEADEGACGCDLREGVKERVDLVLRSDYEKLRQRWGRQSGTIDRERGRAFKAEAERDQARIQLLGELAEFFELQGQMLQAKAEYASERVRPVKAVYQEVAAHCRKLAQEGGE